MLVANEFASVVQLRHGGDPKDWLESESLTERELDFLVHTLPKNEPPKPRARSRSPKTALKSIQLPVSVLLCARLCPHLLRCDAGCD